MCYWVLSSVSCSGYDPIACVHDQISIVYRVWHIHANHGGSQVPGIHRKKQKKHGPQQVGIIAHRDVGNTTDKGEHKSQHKGTGININPVPVLPSFNFHLPPEYNTSYGNDPPPDLQVLQEFIKQVQPTHNNRTQ